MGPHESNFMSVISQIRGKLSEEHHYRISNLRVDLVRSWTATFAKRSSER